MGRVFMNTIKKAYIVSFTPVSLLALYFRMNIESIDDKSVAPPEDLSLKKEEYYIYVDSNLALK